jgi:hypothetical protein
LAFPGAGNPQPGASPGTTSASPGPSRIASASAGIAGTVFAPAEAAGTAVAAYSPIKAARALVYLSSPDEKIYLDPTGRAFATTADNQGRFQLPVEPGKAVIVTAVIAGNRRLVGIGRAPVAGLASADISLESTYATEFFRRYGAEGGKTLADIDLAAFDRAVARTRGLLEAGRLDSAPDLSASAIPALVDAYLIAQASGSAGLADLWTSLIGARPLAATTLDDSAETGFTPTSIAVASGGAPIYVAAYNSTGVMIRQLGHADPIFRKLASDGFGQLGGMAVGPDGYVYFCEQADRKLGGAVDWRQNPPEIRLFRFKPGGKSVEESRLQVPPELAAYISDATLGTHIEPGAVAWNDGKLYVGDVATALIYEFTPDLTRPWPGTVFAGRVSDGRPQAGNADGPRLGGAAFGPVTHLRWHKGELYFADPENSVIRVVGTDGQVRVAAGMAGQRGYSGDGGPVLAARFDHPHGMAFDASGRMFVADSDNKRIRMVDGGKVRTVVGGGKPRTADGDAQEIDVGAIWELQFDAHGNLLFDDESTAKVRRLWLQNGL